MASPNLSDIVSLTLRSFGKMVADNVTNNVPLLLRLKGRGRVKTFDGGYEIQENLSYAGGSYERFSGYERGNPEPVEGITAATYPIRQARVFVTISGLEQLQNAGRARIKDLLKERMTNAEREMTNGLSEDIYSNGTASNNRQITGLDAQIVDDPTSGTVGNISRANYSFWRNQAVTQTTLSSSNVKSAFNKLFMACTRGKDMPDLISCGDNVFADYHDALSDQQRFTNTNSDMARGGFNTLKFRSADVIQGGGVGGNNEANTGYFLNTDFLSFRPHSRENMVFKDTGRPVDQDAMIKVLHWAGNMCSSNLSLQGRLKTT